MSRNNRKQPYWALHIFFESTNVLNMVNSIKCRINCNYRLAGTLDTLGKYLFQVYNL